MSSVEYWLLWADEGRGAPPQHVLDHIAQGSRVYIAYAPTAHLVPAPTTEHIFVLSNSYAVLGLVVDQLQTEKRRVWVGHVEHVEQVVTGWARLLGKSMGRSTAVVLYTWEPCEATIAPIPDTGSQAFRLYGIGLPRPANQDDMYGQWLRVVYQKHRALLPPHEYATLVAEDSAPSDEMVVAFDPPYGRSSRERRQAIMTDDGTRTYITPHFPWSGLTYGQRPAAMY
jgi:hypothetical protein